MKISIEKLIKILSAFPSDVIISHIVTDTEGDRTYTVEINALFDEDDEILVFGDDEWELTEYDFYYNKTRISYFFDKKRREIK